MSLIESIKVCVLVGHVRQYDAGRVAPLETVNGGGALDFLPCSSG